MSSRKREGVAKVDNKKKATLFRPVPAINQKNYYTDYLKRDNQLLANRPHGDDDQSDDEDQIKAIALQIGSANLRVGLVGDANPVTWPVAVARPKTKPNETDQDDFDKPAFLKAYKRIQKDLSQRMQFYKVKESHPEKSNADYNSKSKVESPQDTKDVGLEGSGDPIVGPEALDPPDGYTVSFPLANGSFNEADYDTREQLLGDLSLILHQAIKSVVSKDKLNSYGLVLAVPDLYEKCVVVTLMEMLLVDLNIAKVALIQNALAASFGAGVSSACIVDIGDQTCTVACVDEGLCIGDSRVNLKYGAKDVTTVLQRRLAHINVDMDFKEAQEFRLEHCTADESQVAVRTFELENKRKIKLYDEVMAPVLSLFYPQVFGDLSEKLASKYTLFTRSANVYDGRFDDPLSDAQINCILNSLAVFGESYTDRVSGIQSNEEASTEDHHGDEDMRSETPLESAPTTSTRNAAAAAANAQIARQQQQAAKLDPKQLPATPLDYAIIESVVQAASRSGVGTSSSTFFENLIVIGGFARTPGFNRLLMDRVAMWNETVKDTVSASVMAIPREIDPDEVVWKGCSVFARLKIAEETWVLQSEWGVLGSRILQHKSLFGF